MLNRSLWPFGLAVIVIGAVALAAYFNGRFNDVVFASPTSKITYRVQGTNVDDAISIIEEAEKAIHYRRMTTSQIMQMQSPQPSPRPSLPLDARMPVGL